jgi:hypothetical protein
MLVDEIQAEQLAEVFHHYHQSLASDVNSSQPESWHELTEKERETLVAVARLTLTELDSERNRRKYFARPGEAEWGS